MVEINGGNIYRYPTAKNNASTIMEFNSSSSGGGKSGEWTSNIANKSNVKILKDSIY